MHNATASLFSVVIPSYNRAYTITETLDSVKKQTYRPIEIILVDDGSADNTREIVEQWRLRNEEPDIFTVRYIYQENQGVASARNRGLHEARGQWLQFFDSDDLMYPANLKSHASAFIQHDADMLFAGYDTFDSESGEVRQRSFGFEDNRQLEHVLLSELHVITLRTAFRRDLLEKAGPWNEQMAMSEDTEYIERVLCHARNPWGIREPLAALRRGLSDHRSSEHSQACRVESRESLLQRVAGRADVSLRAKRRLVEQIIRIGSHLFLEGMPTLGRRCVEIVDRTEVPLDRGLRFRLLLLRNGYAGSVLLRCLRLCRKAYRSAISKSVVESISSATEEPHA